MGRVRSLPRKAFCVPVVLLLAAGTVVAAKRGRPPGALEPSSAYAVFVMAKIANAAGLGETPEIYRAPVDAAHAIMVEGREAIVYNPGFLAEVNDRSGTSWAAVSVLAHELGHHYYGHSHEPIDAIPSDVLRERELEADYFSGYVLERMGASLDDAEAAQEALFDDAESPTHPDSYRRLAAISAGWHDGARDDAPSADPDARIARANAALFATNRPPQRGRGNAFPSGRW